MQRKRFDVTYVARLRCLGMKDELNTVMFEGQQTVNANEGTESGEFEHHIAWNVVRKKIARVKHLKFTEFTIKEVGNA